MFLGNIVSSGYFNIRIFSNLWYKMVIHNVSSTVDFTYLLFCIVISSQCSQQYMKTGQNRPILSISYQRYRSNNRRRLKPNRLCKLVVFKSYNRQHRSSLIWFWILRNVHHVSLTKTKINIKQDLSFLKKTRFILM